MNFRITLGSLRKNGTSTALNLKHIYIAGLWTTGGSAVRIKSVFLTNDANATGIDGITAEPASADSPVFNLQGQRVRTMQRGQIYIINGRKTINN